MHRAKFIASGNVQGVGFREFVRRIGSLLLLVGYAKNLPDGTVEIIVEGEKEKIAEFARRISVKMPIGIRVDSLSNIENKEIFQLSFASFGTRH